jgi:hypothetical protein
MAPKVRIKRTNKPALYHATRRNFALGDLCTKILKVAATYGGNLEKEKYDIARTQNRVSDTELKEARQSLLVEQTRRLELLNIQTARELGLDDGQPVADFVVDNYSVRDEESAEFAEIGHKKLKDLKR